MKYIYYLIKYFFTYNYFLLSIFLRDKKTNTLKDTIVSLTSYDNRINNRLVLVIKSILTQTYQPELLVLFVTQNDFNRTISIMNRLMGDVRFKIQIVEDFYSYKKIIPALKFYPNKNVITIDDDIFYPKNFIYNIFKSVKQNNILYVNWGHAITFDLNNKIKKYKDLEFRINNKNSINRLLVPNTGSGAFFSSGLFNYSDYDFDLILKNFKTTDDLYLFYLCCCKHIEIQVLNYTIYELYDPRISNLNLNINNEAKNLNDYSINYINNNLIFK